MVPSGKCDDIVQNEKLLPKLRKAGNIWMLVGFDSSDPKTLESFCRGGIDKTKAKKAVGLLRQNDILCLGTFIIGERKDTHESMEARAGCFPITQSYGEPISTWQVKH